VTVTTSRLDRQIAFLLEADKLKQTLRRTGLADGSRRENSAEHAWHLVLTAMVLSRDAQYSIDLLHVIDMIAVHDLVEIDAGDSFAYDAAAQEGKQEHERAAADRIFGLLPPDQAAQFRVLWDEFEAQSTDDSRFANAIDRLQPLLLDACAGGGTCRGVTRAAVLARMAPVESAIPALWPKVLEIVDGFEAAGVFSPLSP
jgi:putative hydrolase of HD superfamily